MKSERKYFKICDICGASLNPNEKCTCIQEAKREKERAEIDKKVAATLKLFSFGKVKKK